MTHYHFNKLTINFMLSHKSVHYCHKCLTLRVWIPLSDLAKDAVEQNLLLADVTAKQTASKRSPCVERQLSLIDIFRRHIHLDYISSSRISYGVRSVGILWPPKMSICLINTTGPAKAVGAFNERFRRNR